MRSASTGNPPTAAEPKPECRFCLEPGDPAAVAAENPLISPCPCKGSVRYVHWTCLKRWVRLDAANARACTICRQPFDATVFPGFVSLTSGPSAALLFLEHSYTASVVFTYMAFLWHANTATVDGPVWTICWRMTRLGSLWTHAAYAVCAWLCLRELGERGRETYWAAAHRVRMTTLLAGHAYALYQVAIAAPEMPDYLALAAMQYLLRVYWNEHTATLSRVNAGLLRDFAGY